MIPRTSSYVVFPRNREGPWGTPDAKGVLEAILSPGPMRASSGSLPQLPFPIWGDLVVLASMIYGPVLKSSEANPRTACG